VRGYDFSSWFGFFAPGETPKAVIAKLNQEIVQILKTPEMKKSADTGRGGRSSKHSAGVQRTPGVRNEEMGASH
jgi:tripartite-type tricarboxylate transporter receptor subunit TctC